MNKKTTLLFDLDGTLFDSIPVILKCFQETFQALRIDYPGDTEIKKHIGFDLERIFRNFLSEEKVADAARAVYREFYLPKQDAGIIPLFPDTIEVLEYFKIRNFTLGIVTSKKREHSLKLFQQNQIDHFFDIIVGSEDVENCKPSAEPLLKALKHLNKTVPESIYIGDALVDLQAAQNAQMDFIALTTGTTTAEDFRKNGQNSFATLKNLCDLYPRFTKS